MSEGRLASANELPDDFAVRFRERMDAETYSPFTDLRALLRGFTHRLRQDVMDNPDLTQATGSAYALIRIARGDFADGMQEIKDVGDREVFQETAIRYAGWLGINLSDPPDPIDQPPSGQRTVPIRTGGEATVELSGRLDRTQELDAATLRRAAAAALSAADTREIHRPGPGSQYDLNDGPTVGIPMNGTHIPGPRVSAEGMTGGPTDATVRLPRAY